LLRYMERLHPVLPLSTAEAGMETLPVASSATVIFLQIAAKTGGLP
jgi:hypothetical protein